MDRSSAKLELQLTIASGVKPLNVIEYYFLLKSFNRNCIHILIFIRMKISPILFLKGTVLGWDGPWDGVNVLTDDVLQSNDLMELNRDPKLTFIGRVSQSS